MRTLLAGLMPAAILAVAVARAEVVPPGDARTRTAQRQHADRPSARDDSRKGGHGEVLEVLLGSRTTRYAVTFHHLHTRELLPVALRVPDERLASFLRCRATGDEHAMSDVPIRVAMALARHYAQPRVEIVSGYRSIKLNERLRKKSHEVAAESQHTHGNALDFRVPGVPAVELARAASELHLGGIGTYRESDFIHVDTGRARRWNGR